MKIKKNLPKVLSAAMSLTILCSSVGVAAYSAGVDSTGQTAVKTEAKKDAAVKATSETKKADKKQYNKEESVYVIADAQGNPNKVIVSDWIQNTGKAQKLSDRSNLKDIEVVKGDASFTMNENNACEWDAKGDDIYFKGTGSVDLPVGVSIVYELDGKPTAPKDLAGKSGKLKIKINYTNRQFEETEINGKKEKIYVPFVMLTGMMLDNEIFNNVKVSNGKVINDGSHTYVAGFALPGMADSLKLKKDELDIPSAVEITADVKDFALATTLTVATNDLFSDLDVGKLDSKVKDLSKQLNKLTDATGKLLDGTSKLYKGVSTMLEKSGALTDGFNELQKGAKTLKTGTSSLKSGTGDLKNGAVTLDNGVGTLKNGANTLANGAGSLAGGAVQVDNGAGSLAGGAVQVDNGAGQLQGYLNNLSGGLNTISANSAQLRSGAKQVFNTFLSTADTQIAAAGLTAEKLTIGNYAKVLTGLINSLSDENAQKLAYDTALKTVTATVNSQKSVIRQSVEDAVKKQVTEGVLAASGYTMTAEQYDAALAAGEIPEEAQKQIAGAIASQMTTMQATIDTNTDAQINAIIKQNMESQEVTTQINTAVAKAKGGRQSLQALKTQLDSYNTFYNGILSYTTGVDSAGNGAKEILNGAGTLKNGTASLKNGANQLKSGTGSLKDGANQLNKGTGDLNKGAKELKTGSGKLRSGTVTLHNGAQTLDTGVGSLVDGIGSLKNGTVTLINGIKTLKSGSMELDKGMKEYKKEGVDKLKKAADGDVKTLVERIKAIANASKNYKSYSGIADNADGKVNFIFKTDGIEEE